MSFSDFVLNLTALKKNVQTVKNEVGEKVKICAMVKADAYGHGVIPVASALGGIVDYFGVASILEAEQLRRVGVLTPILIVGVVEYDQINWCARSNVTISITSLEDAVNASERAKFPLKVHIKINSGMNRYGFSDFNELNNALKLLRQNKNINIEGVFTHFACKADDKEFIAEQFEKFVDYVNVIDQDDLIIHCSNSYAGLCIPKLRMSMIRIGFALYGWQPGPFQFEPVLSIKSQILNIHNIKKGESVGYGRAFYAKNNMRIGLIPLGYADGFDRRLSNSGYVLIHGKKAKVIGNICMDAFMVDITDIENVRIGDEVTVLGEGDGEFLGTKVYSDLLGTSEYEILLKFKYHRMNIVTK